MGVMGDGKRSGADVLRVMMTTPIQTSCEDAWIGREIVIHCAYEAVVSHLQTSLPNGGQMMSRFGAISADESNDG